jgi:hypothetical protein
VLLFEKTSALANIKTCCFNEQPSSEDCYYAPCFSIQSLYFLYLGTHSKYYHTVPTVPYGTMWPQQAASEASSFKNICSAMWGGPGWGEAQNVVELTFPFRLPSQEAS